MLMPAVTNGTTLHNVVWRTESGYYACGEVMKNRGALRVS